MSRLCGVGTVGSGEGLVYIGDDVGDVLDAYRESDEVGATPASRNCSSES